MVDARILYIKPVHLQLIELFGYWKMKVFIIVVVGLILSTDVDGSKSLNISGI